MSETVINGTIKRENILGTEDVSKLLKMFSLPAMASMLANALYNIIDQVFIGHSVGYLGNAATTVAFPIVTIVLAIGTLLGVGGSAFVAIKLGEGKDELAERTFNMVSSWIIVIGIILAALGLIFIEPILTIFGATAETMELSKDFSGIMIAIMPLSLLLVCLANMARTDGSPRLTMKALVGGVIVNLVLAPVFIFIFDWGITGAALATAAAQIFSVVVLMEYFLKHGKMRIRKEYFFCRDWQSMRILCAIGFSSFITQISGTLMQIILNNSIVYYGNLSKYGGEVALSALGIVMKLNMIFIAVCIGIGIGAQPIVGFNRGAKKWERVKSVYLTAVKAATVVSVVGWACCEFFPRMMLSAFGANGDLFMEFGVIAMRIFLLFVFLAGFQIISITYFQGTGQALKATILSSLRQLLILIPLVLILPLKFGLLGILYGSCIADLVSTLIVGIFVYKEIKFLNGKILASKNEN